jgi:hypothetical protein
MWYAFLTFAWKRTPISALSFGSCYCLQGSVKKKVLRSLSVAAPPLKLWFSLLWRGEQVFVKRGKTAAKTHMMLLAFYGSKTLCRTHVFE